MNKQEAIKRIEAMSFRDKTFKEIKAEVAKIISQIDQPQKVEVPAFIDSFIRYAKAEGMSLYIAMDNAQNKESEWIIKNEEIFARAWLDSYTIEQERLYTVEIPNPNNRFSVVFLTKENGKVHIGAGTFFDNVPDDKWEKGPNTHLTEAEIKQDFEWAWDAGFAKEVERWFGQY